MSNAGEFGSGGSLKAPAVNNSGSFGVDGVLTANGTAFNNLTGGTLILDVDTSFTGIGALTNAGTVLLTKPAEIFGPESLPATTFINNAGATLTSVAVLATTGGLTNNGTVNADDGAIDGPITNNGTFNISPTYTVYFTVTSNSTFNNAKGATLTVGQGMSYTVGSLLTNSGALTVSASGGSLADMAGIINTSTGTLTTTGTLNVTAGGLLNNGIVNASGTITGAVTNKAAAAFTMTGNVGASPRSLMPARSISTRPRRSMRRWGRPSSSIMRAASSRCAMGRSAEG